MIYKHNWKIESTACAVSEIFIVTRKMTWFSSRWVEQLSQQWAICDCFIICFYDYFLPFKLTFICKKRFYNALKNLFVTIFFEIFLKYCLILLFLKDTHLFRVLFCCTFASFFVFHSLTLSVRVIVFATLSILLKNIFRVWIYVSLIQDVQVGPVILDFQ